MENDKYFASVLALDDNPLNLRLIKEILTKNNYKIWTTTDPYEAYKIYTEEKIDLVILDIKIRPNKENSLQNQESTEYITGYDVIKKLKELNSLNQAPIIFLTSVSDPNSKVSAFKAGAVDFITKPFNSSELVARIETQVKLKRATEKIYDYSTGLEKNLADKTKQLETYTRNLEQMVEEKVGIIKMTNEILQKDLDSARRMQRALLPKKFPTLKRIKVEAHYYSCDRVGGDFYDVFNLDEDNIGFYVADVSGHGVSAAMVTFFVKELINSLKKTIFQNGSYNFTSPALLMEKVNLKMLEEDFEGIYITIFYAILNIKTGEMTWSNAGHIAYPIIFRSEEKKSEIIKAKSMALGWFDYARYVDEKIIINPNDKIIIYSDGIIECKNKDSELYGVERLSEIIKNNGHKSLSSLTFRILKELRKFQRGKELEDDMTILLFEYL